ncbi:hypothetical protein [Agrobacterium rosae]|uniref:hypothetical protein n=1 Tax=Agrobacterium rosae TaxID=1972867 RepID=UPI00203400E5|nr:hypothetical protein [Agrobacterium rosae]MCM2431975.1 hypothetical protein [Agrobacterium rosae]
MTTPKIKCGCCDDSGKVKSIIEGDMRPCSRCQYEAFKTWADSRRPNIEMAGAA